MDHSKIALITGASSGIGQATAKLLAAKGFTVFGTSRKPELHGAPPYKLIPLDVRSDLSVAAAIQFVIEQAGRIDILINNAGYTQAGAIEENSLTDIQAQLDTNLLGTIRLTNALLPIMRQQSAGHIINISSVVGWVAPPYLGVYAASKFALEGMTEALRYEVKPFNIHVSLIESGFVRTNIAIQPPGNPLPDYAPRREKAQELVHSRVENGVEPEIVAQTIFQAITTTNPRLRYRVDRAANLLIMLKRFLPEPFFERVRSRIFNVPRPASVKA